MLFPNLVHTDKWAAMPRQLLIENSRELAFALRDPSAAGQRVDLCPAARACILSLVAQLDPAGERRLLDEITRTALAMTAFPEF